MNLDGTTGIGSSFLDEAFGGLVSKEGMPREEVVRRLKIQSAEDRTYEREAWEAVRLAASPEPAFA